MDAKKTHRPAHKTPIARFAIRLLQISLAVSGLGLILGGTVRLMHPDCFCSTAAMTCHHCGVHGEPVAFLTLLGFIASSLLLLIGVPMALLIGAIWERLPDQWEDTNR